MDAPVPKQLTDNPFHTAFVAIGSATPANLVALHYASLGAQTLSTLEKALRLNYITGFTGLNVETLCKFPPRDSIPMIKGHLDQSRKISNPHK